MTSIVSGGTFRVNNLVFPVPAAQWQAQVLAQGLDRLPITSMYETMIWNWPELEPDYFKDLYALYLQSLADPTVLRQLETTSYDAYLAGTSYNTEVYTDFRIISLNPRTEGIPNYDNVTVVFEVYIG